MSKRFVKITLAAKVRLLFGAATILIVGAALVVPWLYLEGREEDNLMRAGSELTRIYQNEWTGAHPHGDRPHLPELYIDPQNAADLRKGPVFIPLDATHNLPENADDSARQALTTFLGDTGTSVAQVGQEDHGQRVYRVYRALRVDSSCMTAACHAQDPAVRPQLQWKANDLKGLIEVQLPADPPTELIWGRIIIIAAGALAFLLATMTFYFITRRLVLAPVHSLKSVADKVAEGDLSVRSDLSTGDEFEQLGHSFDEMLSAVTDTQEQLRAANRALDLKLNELAESNVALYESNRLKSEFLANVSHELRTPLNSIIGFADLLGEDGDERVRRYAGNIQTPARMLLRIINDLLDLARIEAGKVKLTVTMASIQDICETLISLVTPLAQKKNLELRMEMCMPMPTIKTDAGKVQQILYNLLSNAIKFTPPGGEVLVRAQAVYPISVAPPPPGVGVAALVASRIDAAAPVQLQEAPASSGLSPTVAQAAAAEVAAAAAIGGDGQPSGNAINAVAAQVESATATAGNGSAAAPTELPAAETLPPAPALNPIGVAVHVIDTGPGISEAEQVAIFEKFYQSNAAHTREHGGVGLGLAIARDLADVLGGKLSLTSQIGQGATFTLALPLEIKQGGKAVIE